MRQTRSRCMKTALLLPLLFLSAHLHAAERVALVVGCASYTANPDMDLDTPANDASEMARTLRQPGLDFAVTELINATRSTFHEALATFEKRALGAEVALVFFSGHGMEIEGQNYLITSDAVLASPSSVAAETMPISTVVTAMKNTRSKVKLIIADCCRDNPFTSAPSSSVSAKAWKSVSRQADDRVLRALGEAEIPEATLICFATSAGRKAAAILNSSSVRSPFTDILVEELPVPQRSLRDIFEQVHDRLKLATAGRQVPNVQTDNALSEVFRHTVLVRTVPPVSSAPVVQPRQPAATTTPVTRQSPPPEPRPPGGNKTLRSVARDFFTD